MFDTTSSLQVEVDEGVQFLESQDDASGKMKLDRTNMASKVGILVGVLLLFTYSLFHRSKDLFCRVGHRLPSLLVIGAAKSGTTSLAHVLNLQPTLSFGIEKQHEFIGKFDLMQKWAENGFSYPPIASTPRTNEDYAKEFPRCEKVRKAFDASPMISLLDFEPIEKIQEMYTKAEQKELIFVFLLEDPVERVRKHYYELDTHYPKPMNKFIHSRIHAKADSFTDFGLIEMSKYGTALKAFLSAFPENEFILIQSKYFFTHQQEVVKDVMTRMGQPYRAFRNTHKRKHDQKRREELSSENREALWSFLLNDMVVMRRVIEQGNRIRTYPRKDFVDGLIPEDMKEQFEILLNHGGK